MLYTAGWIQKLNWNKYFKKLLRILEAHKGKTVVVNVWASWCKDCIVGLPNLKALQARLSRCSIFVFSYG